MKGNTIAMVLKKLNYSLSSSYLDFFSRGASVFGRDDSVIFF